MKTSNHKVITGYIIASSVLIFVLTAGMVFTTITLYQVKRNVATTDSDVRFTDVGVSTALGDLHRICLNTTTTDTESCE